MRIAKFSKLPTLTGKLVFTKNVFRKIFLETTYSKINHVNYSIYAERKPIYYCAALFVGEFSIMEKTTRTGDISFAVDLSTLIYNSSAELSNYDQCQRSLIGDTVLPKSATIKSALTIVKKRNMSRTLSELILLEENRPLIIIGSQY